MSDQTDDLWRLLTFQDYNTRVVLLGTTVLGIATGIIGPFLLLRKRALISDALSHATLPGIALGFILMVQLGGSGKWLPGLLAGAFVTGLIGVGLVLLIRNLTRIKEDAALGIVLSVFFGLGVVLLGMIQKMKQGSAAGIETFIYGKTASMLASDAYTIVTIATVCAVVCVLFFKEFTLLCFDQEFAASRGWSVTTLDMAMMTLVTVVTVAGLQAVGLILIIALLIIPPAAARFWTERLGAMVIISAFIGAVSGLVGAALSALVPRLPAGAVIVVVAAVMFAISMMLGPTRGILARLLQHLYLNRRIHRQNLLRAMYERLEQQGEGNATCDAADRQSDCGIDWDDLLQARSWSPRHLRNLLFSAQRRGLVYGSREATYQLTHKGMTEAAQVMRNHRLWETYLVTYAEIAPSHVDRDADMIEHVLGHDMVHRLEALLAHSEETKEIPRSPHAIAVPDRRGNTI